MIDINELRRLAQAATPGPWIAAGPSFGESLPKHLNEVVVDREGDEDDGYSICNAPIGLNEERSDDMAFIAEANPLAIEELLDRLEAAEKSDAESMAMYRRVRGERDALRAKVEAMEKQLPVKYEFQGRDGKWYPFIDQRHYENTVADGTWPIRSLYALPGAQNVPSVPACADIMDAARYRWLRENGLAHEKRESRAVLPRGGKKASMAFRYWTTPEELDMAIDAMLIVAPEAKP